MPRITHIFTVNQITPAMPEDFAFFGWNKCFTSADAAIAEIEVERREGIDDSDQFPEALVFEEQQKFGEGCRLLAYDDDTETHWVVTSATPS